ncbi:MAG: NifB/NifX family molybdenum-iron cluster-binding protein [bacterium]
MLIRVAIATDGDFVSQHFGKCQTYTIVDIENGKIIKKELVTNPGLEGHQSGILPEFLYKKGVNYVIAGGMGPRAVDFFNQFGIQPIVGVSGDIKHTIEKFIVGELQSGRNMHELFEHEHEHEHEHTHALKDDTSLVCITASGPDLDADVDPRFGRAPYFILVNPDTLEFVALENANADAEGGAGTQAGQFIISNNVKALLTGSVGPNAYETLNAAGVKIYTGITGTVKQVIKDYKAGKLKTTEKSGTGSMH